MAELGGEEASEYKEEDDIDLDVCFEQLEKELVNFKQKVSEESQDALEKVNSELESERESSKQERVDDQVKLAELN
jgi:hypothetical protein